MHLPKRAKGALLLQNQDQKKKKKWKMKGRPTGQSIQEGGDSGAAGPSKSFEPSGEPISTLPEYEKQKTIKRKNIQIPEPVPGGSSYQEQDIQDEKGLKKSAWGTKIPYYEPSPLQSPSRSAWGPQKSENLQRQQQQQQQQQHRGEHSARGVGKSQCEPLPPGPPAKSAWGPPEHPQRQQQQQQQQQHRGEHSAWGVGKSRCEPLPPGPPAKSAWGPPEHPQRQQQQQQQQQQHRGEHSAWGVGKSQCEPFPPGPPAKSAWGPPEHPQKKRIHDTSSAGEQQERQSQKVPVKPQGERSEEFTKGKEEFESLSKGFSEISTSPEGKSVVPVAFAPRIYATRKSGRPISVYSNFFRLKIQNPNLVVYDYDVKIDPDKPKNLMREVWNKFAAKELRGRLSAFSGNNAYSNGPLINGKSHSGSVVIRISENKEREFKIEIQEVGRVSFQSLDNYRERMQKDPSMKVLPEAETRLLDIILRNWASDNFVKSGRSFFAPLLKNPREIPLSDKLIMRNGFYQAAFLGYELYVNFDLSHKAFYRPIQMLDLFDCFRSRGPVNIEEMDRFIRGVKIKYELPNEPSSKRIYSVNNLVRNANSQTFKKEDGSELTVAKYLLEEKKIKLKYPELPLVWVGSRQKTIYLPLEFCTIVPDQVCKVQVDPVETREMVKNSTADARRRKNDLYKIFDEMNINKQPLMKEFGLMVSNEMERVEGRVLEAPKLKTSCPVRVNEGTWRIRDFLEPKELKNWCILKLDRKVPREKIMDLQNLLKDRGRNFNMKVNDPARSVIELEPQARDIEKILRELGNMDLVIVIIPDMKGVYAKIKTISETRATILTQCIKSRTLFQDPRKISTTVENILLKVNAKLGGINHTLDKTSIPDCMKGNVMIVGADVTHPSPGMKAPSVAAVAVSCDEAAFKYSTTTRVQPKGEIIVDLEEIIRKHVLEFQRLRKCYPDKIIFFRDGVSEGELEKVFHLELAAVKRACQKYCQPKITFLVVQKRHHTRFYPEFEQDEVGRNYNVPPGTCVDSKIVHPRDMDFYLVSHASILGTARPTRYRLVYDDNRLTDDELERLSYYLCHMFSRCNRSVSYPSPTYNAHLAAFRVRAYLEEYRGVFDIADIQKHVNEKISEKAPMFFV